MCDPHLPTDPCQAGSVALFLNNEFSQVNFTCMLSVRCSLLSDWTGGQIAAEEEEESQCEEEPV